MAGEKEIVSSERKPPFDTNRGLMLRLAAFSVYTLLVIIAINFE
jgi:hypothetical protein